MSRIVVAFLLLLFFVKITYEKASFLRQIIGILYLLEFHTCKMVAINFDFFIARTLKFAQISAYFKALVLKHFTKDGQIFHFDFQVDHC